MPVLLDPSNAIENKNDWCEMCRDVRNYKIIDKWISLTCLVISFQDLLNKSIFKKAWKFTY